MRPLYQQMEYMNCAFGNTDKIPRRTSDFAACGFRHPDCESMTP